MGSWDPVDRLWFCIAAAVILVSIPFIAFVRRKISARGFLQASAAITTLLTATALAWVLGVSWLIAIVIGVASGWIYFITSKPIFEVVEGKLKKG